MAEGWTQNVLCRYFINGICREGDRCKFSHDRSIAKPTLTCKFYLRGTCAYGSSCRYDHLRPSKHKADLNAENKSKNDLVTKLPSPVIQTEIDKSLDNYSTYGSTKKIEENWVDAPEFIPSNYQNAINKSYAAVVNPKCDSIPSEDLCPFAMVGECRFGSQCCYLHGDICDMCGQACLHPYSSSQRKEHQEECAKAIEKDMELSFAVARSKDKSCGICMDLVLEKNPCSKRRFGILLNCTHIFCLSCIRKWRKAKQFEHKIVRSCPECRVTSDFVVPSRFWVEDVEEKSKLIGDYKVALSSKPCKYFKEGRGECPFGNKCFYLHALPDGRKADVGPPRRRKASLVDADVGEFLEGMLLYEFMENRVLLEFPVEHLTDFIYDSDDSDWSDISFD